MTENPERSTNSYRQVILLIVASLLALVLPFVLISRFFGSGDASGTAAPQATTRPAAQSTPAAAASSSSPRSTSAKAAPSPSQAVVPGDADQQAVATLAATTEGCRIENLRQKAALGAAAVSLAQFQKHIDAMNLWVSGKISYAVATTFWDQTRVAATTNVATFKKADRDLVAGTAKCQVLSGSAAGWAPSQTSEVQACVDGLAAGSKALSLARQAAATWAHHVEDMEMLRMGHITPAQSRAMWQKNWKQGQKQLKAYNTALAKAEKSPCAFD
jgi:hypothetical protein